MSVFNVYLNAALKTHKQVTGEQLC